MKNLFLLGALGVSCLLIVAYNVTHQNQAYGQVGNLTSIIELKFPEVSDPQISMSAISPVEVRYESPTSVVIGGDLIFSGFFNTDLWEAMDLLRNQYGFKVQQVMTSGVGSVGNPTNIYILMTK